MSPGRRVRVAKCQMLATCFLVVLLALCVATFVTVTYFGAHMAVIHQASPGRNPYKESHRWAFYLGTGLAGILATGAVLSAAATVREAQGLMAAGFLCFALAFCALVQVVLWRLHHPTQVEEAALDTFDLVYDRALRTASGAWQRGLAAIQDAFLCCGKRSPFSFLGHTGANQCHGAGAPREDCLEGIRSFLRTQQKVDLALLSTALALTVHALLLSSFLWFAIRTCRGLHHRGKYALTPRQPPLESVLPLQSRR